MFNRLLALTIAAMFLWLFVNAPPREATTPHRAEHSTAPVQPVSSTDQHQDPLTLTRAPVPLLRAANVPVATRPSSTASAATESPASTEEATAQEELDRKAAKAAVEADGYKSVSVLGRTVSGAWRARAYRGVTEVNLTVDGTGRVSQD